MNTTIKRLKAMKACLQEVQTRQTIHDDWPDSRFICILIEQSSQDYVVQADTKSLIQRALDGYYTLDKWHEHTQGRELTEEESFSLRKKWVKKLIQDCTAEIKRLSREDSHGPR